MRGIGVGRHGGPSSNRSCLHVRFTDLDENPDAFEESAFEKSIIQSFMGVNGEAAEPQAHKTRRDKWQWMIQEFLGQELDEDWIWDIPVLAHQDSIAFTLVPTGTAEQPSWGSYLAVHLTEAELGSLVDYLALQRSFLTDALAGVDSPHGDTVITGLYDDPIARFGSTIWTKVGGRAKTLERNYVVQWPTRFALPISAFGQFSVSPVHLISDSGTVNSTRKSTNGMLMEVANGHAGLVDVANTHEAEFTTHFKSAVERLETDANSFLDLTGPHFFTLNIWLKSPGDWFMGEVPEWTASADGTNIPLELLSGAELRWALAAIQWAISGLDESKPQMFVIDEPEHGLHRMREQELPRMLGNLGGRSSSSWC